MCPQAPCPILPCPIASLCKRVSAPHHSCYSPRSLRATAQYDAKEYGRLPIQNWFLNLQILCTWPPRRAPWRLPCNDASVGGDEQASNYRNSF